MICREYSKQLNESRLKVLQARENAVHDLVHDAQQGLSSFSKDQQKYKTLLTDLLVQVRHGSSILTGMLPACMTPGSFDFLSAAMSIPPYSTYVAGMRQKCLMLHKDCLNMHCIEQATTYS